MIFDVGVVMDLVYLVFGGFFDFVFVDGLVCGLVGVFFGGIVGFVFDYLD